MRIDKIELKNYRCFDALQLELHSKLTVLVANNGQGKTAILDAIRAAVWPFVSQFDLARTAYKDPANSISINDIRKIKEHSLEKNNPQPFVNMVRQLPASIKTTADYGKGIETWKRFRTSEAPNSKVREDATCDALRSHAKGLQDAIRKRNSEKIDLPLFAYYGTRRLSAKKRAINSKNNNDDKLIRTFAYKDCLDPTSSYKAFAEWFIRINKSILATQIKRFQNNEKTALPDSFFAPKLVIQKAVNQVLAPVGWKDLDFAQEENESLVLTHETEGVIPVEDLSDGIRNTLAIVADIAYRAFQLNPHLSEKAAELGRGIVLIDEIDLHLHPMWQQSIISSLQRSFPNIQFVLTTHSPQVLSTIKAESIRLLQHTVDPETGKKSSHAVVPQEQTQGVSSSYAMAALQHVDSTPNIAPALWLRDYKALIANDDLISKKAKELEEKILAHFGEQHFEWLECQRLIRLEKVKEKFTKLKK